MAAGYRKTNSKRKPRGKPVLVGFTLQYSTAMDPASAGSTANYGVGAATTKTVKGKKVTTYKPVGFGAAYDPAKHSVTLTLAGKQAFAAGGEITGDYAPVGVVGQDGLAPDPHDGRFTIQKKASSITPG